jgi:hypothetical protein
MAGQKQCHSQTQIEKLRHKWEELDSQVRSKNIEVHDMQERAWHIIRQASIIDDALRDLRVQRLQAWSTYMKALTKE